MALSMKSFRSGWVTTTLPLLVLLAMALGCAAMMWSYATLASRGETAAGEYVNDKTVTFASSEPNYGYPRPSTRTGTVQVVAFTTADGERVQVTTTLPPHRRGDRLSVLYDPESPEHACVEPCGLSRSLWSFGIAGILCLALAGWMMFKQRSH